MFQTRQVWIPTTLKKSSIFWRPIVDDVFASQPKFFSHTLERYYHDPPLTGKGIQTAIEISNNLYTEYGPPDIIAYSPRRRTRQMASRAWFDPRFPQYCVILALHSLGLPDNREYDSEHPDADENGIVAYGERSNEEQWLAWQKESEQIISFLAANKTAWIFTHHELVAAAMLRTTKQQPYILERGDIQRFVLSKEVPSYYELNRKVALTAS